MTITKDEEIIKRGINAYPQIINPKDKLLETIAMYKKTQLAQFDYPIHQMTLENALYDAHTFLKYYYKLHKVPTLEIKKLFGFNIHIGKTISPLKLPLSFHSSPDIFSGSVTEVLTNQKPHIIFRQINLPVPITEQTSGSYVHEITHTQLDRLKGSIREYYNSEVISIFNELFHSAILDKDERILRLNDSRRIHEIAIIADELRAHHDGKKELDREELLENCKYLISDLKAYNLFVIFYNSNNEVKNEILDGIQAIFDGYLTVEELLLKYDITYDSIQESPKLLKYFNR